MAEAGLTKNAQVLYAPQTSRETQAIARHVLQSRHPPDAIFCWTDFIALEVLSVARGLGLSVPGDLAVVGYDNTSYCDLEQNAPAPLDPRPFLGAMCESSLDQQLAVARRQPAADHSTPSAISMVQNSTTSECAARRT